MTQALTYQCPNCMGVLAFDSSSGKLVCAHCDSVFEPAAIEALYAQRQAAADAKVANEGGPSSSSAQNAGEGAPAVAPIPAPQAAAPSSEPAAPGPADPVAAYLSRANWESLPDDEVAAMNCTSCGAQLLTDKTTAATTCPYCGNNTIVAGQLAGALKPDFVIPFKQDRQAAIAALKRFYQGKKLLPKAFTEQNHLEEVTGLYVPFWLYSGTAEATLDMNGRTINTWMDSKNTYVQTSHFAVHRKGHMDFHHVPVDASTKMPDAHMDAIEPYDYRELVPFSVGYLPGFLTDRYDQDPSACQPRAHHRMRITCEDILKDSVTGYAETDVVSSSASLELSGVAYALLPVWMLHTRWNGQDYLFAMNGQTGQLVGDLPIDKGKVVRHFLLWFVPSLIIVFLAVYFLLGFGY